MTRPTKRLGGVYQGFDDREVVEQLYITVKPHVGGRFKDSINVPLVPSSLYTPVIRRRCLSTGVAVSAYGLRHVVGKETFDVARPVIKVEVVEPESNRPNPRSQSDKDDLRETFERLKRAWVEKSEHMSVVADMVLLDEYLEIIGLGPRVIPLIIETLRNEGGHWFFALKALAGGVDHAAGAKTVKEGRKRWIEWYESANKLCDSTI